MDNSFDFSNILSSIDFKMPEMPEVELVTDHIYSDAQFEIIKKHITKFQSELDDEHEVGMLLTSFGQSMLMNVTHISYEKYVLLVFRGFVNGQQATLIQHINQINFLLTSVPKAEPEKPANRIGFDTSKCK